MVATDVVLLPFQSSLKTEVRLSVLFLLWLDQSCRSSSKVSLTGSDVSPSNQTWTLSSWSELRREKSIFAPQNSPPSSWWPTASTWLQSTRLSGILSTPTSSSPAPQSREYFCGTDSWASRYCSTVWAARWRTSAGQTSPAPSSLSRISRAVWRSLISPSTSTRLSVARWGWGTQHSTLCLTLLFRELLEAETAHWIILSSIRQSRYLQLVAVRKLVQTLPPSFHLSLLIFFS